MYHFGFCFSSSLSTHFHAFRVIYHNFLNCIAVAKHRGLFQQVFYCCFIGKAAMIIVMYIIFSVCVVIFLGLIPRARITSQD